MAVSGLRGSDDGRGELAGWLGRAAVSLHASYRIEVVPATAWLVLYHSRKTRLPSAVIRAGHCPVVDALHVDVVTFLAIDSC